MLNINSNRYNIDECESFMRSHERNGMLSNMTNGMSITINGITFQSSEGLYQAYKFPDNPQLQLRIARANNGMSAKKIAYNNDDQPMEHWDNLRIDAMRLALSEKLCQNSIQFGLALIFTRRKDIVEKSYRDPFWGAKPNGNTLTGQNVLGKLLTELRNMLRKNNYNFDQTVNEFTKNINKNNFRINNVH